MTITLLTLKTVVVVVAFQAQFVDTFENVRACGFVAYQPEEDRVWKRRKGKMNLKRRDTFLSSNEHSPADNTRSTWTLPTKEHKTRLLSEDLKPMVVTEPGDETASIIDLVPAAPPVASGRRCNQRSFFTLGGNREGLLQTTQVTCQCTCCRRNTYRFGHGTAKDTVRLPGCVC